MSALPHGGVLVNRYAEPSRVEELAEKCGRLKSWQLTECELCDLEMIASGALSPLTGFMGRSDFRAVLDNLRLSKGLPWTIPIHLAVSQSFGASLKPGEEVALLDLSRKPIAILTVSDVFDYNALEYAHKVFRTTDTSHPGVTALYAMGPKMIGGEIAVLRRRGDRTFTHYRFEPSETRDMMESRGWRTMAGFQAREPVYRTHEYLQKCTLETVDGLFLHAASGMVKAGDLSDDVRIQCIEAVIDNYFPKNRVILAVHSEAPRYAGAREAVFDAIVRRNYGCTHFIVGRDAATAGNPAGPSEVQELFARFESKELGITPLFFEAAFYCRACGGMATSKTCPHTDVAKLGLNAKAVRELLEKGKTLPLEFTRAEVGVVLLDAFRAGKKPA